MPDAQLLPFGLDDAPSRTVVQYQSLTGQGEVSTWTSTENEVYMLIPTDGVLTNMWCKASVAPGVGTSWSIAVRQNNTTTSLACPISGTSTFGSSKYRLSVSAGDVVNLISTPTSSPTAATMTGAVEFHPNNPDESILIGGPGDVSIPGSGTRHYCLHGIANGATTESDVYTIIPEFGGGTFGYITKLYVWLESPPASSASRTFEIRKNGTLTGMSVTISGLSTSGNTTNSINVNQGDYISLHQTGTSSPTATKAAWGIVIEPVRVGEYLICGVSGASIDTIGSGYEYNRLATGNSSWTSTKTDKVVGGQFQHFVRSMGVRLTRAPGGVGKAHEFYIENPSSGGPRVYVENAAVFNNTTEMCYGLKNAGNANIRHLAYNSPAVATASWSMQMRYIPPGGL